MKKIFHKSERGSIMIEALAMLALIALVTPLLYKKTSERMRELQDINSASELRSIVKAVDDYVSSNYDTLVQGGTITNNCTQNSQSYSGLTGTDHRVTVPIGHFCEFLPYGVLKNDGTAQVSKLFQDYKIVLKLRGDAGTPNADPKNNVITAFVVTEPRVDMVQLRSSSIASMIGGNGGYVDIDDKTPDAEGKIDGTIKGNLGLWGIENTSDELGIKVKKGAVVAASIQGISSQNANIDIDDVLYRRERAQKDLNTMFTTLYMGSSGNNTYGHDIVNINRLIVGSRSASTGDRLYLKSGNIHIGSEGGTSGNIQLDGKGDVLLKGSVNNITISTKGSISTKEGEIKTSKGNIDTAAGNIYTTKGDVYTSEGNLKTDKGGALLISNSADTAIKVNSDVFTVAKDGVTKAVNFQTNDGNVKINVDSKTSIKEPVVIISSGTCTYSNHAGCALQVGEGTDKSGAYINGNLIVEDTFSAENLHARKKLTVGGDGEDDGNALIVNGATANQAGLSFGSGLFEITQSAASQGSLTFASSLISAHKDATNTNDYVKLTTNTSKLELTNNKAFLQGTSNDKLELTTDNAKLNSKNIYLNYATGNKSAFEITGTNTALNTYVATVTMTPKDKTSYLKVSNAGTYGSIYAKALDTYFQTNANSPATYLHIGTAAGTSQQMDISPKKITMKKEGQTTASAANNILKIDLEHTDVSTTTFDYGNQESHPVYIRKGAVELKAFGDYTETAYNTVDSNKEVYNYVKADRFISNKKTNKGDLLNSDETQMNSTNYIVNPAYTSIMRDIKLTSRGGARLSDILPDFINKGIYVVDNTYPAKGEKCTNDSNKIGKSLSDYQSSSGGGALATGKGYKKYSDPDDGNFVGQCDSSTQEVSPWLGFVPRPTCPPGYMAVITLTPTSFAMAQAGFAHRKSEWMSGRNGRSSTTDLYTLTNSIKSPLDYTGEDAEADAPIPFYSQKNTWLKSDALPYPTNCSSDCKGWDLSMGFIYPYQWYSTYITEAQTGSDKLSLDMQGPGAANNYDQKVIWNLFPVYAGSLEGYATVYCYFQRKPKNITWNQNTVDTGYDQIGNFRNAKDYSAAGSLKTNSAYQNANDFDYGYW